MTERVKLTGAQRHSDAAERIIKLEGLTFALAALTGKEMDTARALLKNAICKALADEGETAGRAALTAQKDG